MPSSPIWWRAGSAKKSSSRRSNSCSPGSTPSSAAQRQRLELAVDTLEEIRLLDVRLQGFQATHHRRCRRVRDRPHGTVRDRSRDRCDRDRLQRRHRPFPDRRALRRLQRHRPDRVLLLRAEPCTAYRGAATAPSTTPSTSSPSPRSATAPAKAAATTTANVDDGKTAREAIRALKRRISERDLPTTPRRRSSPIGPGGQSGNDSHIQRGRRNPGTRHFGISHSRTQTRTLRRPERHRHRARAARPHDRSNLPLDTKRDRYLISRTRQHCGPAVRVRR